MLILQARWMDDLATSTEADVDEEFFVRLDPIFLLAVSFRAAWSDCDCDAPQSGAVERFWCSSSRGASISRRSRADRPPWAGRSKNRARPVALGGWMV